MHVCNLYLLYCLQMTLFRGLSRKWMLLAVGMTQLPLPVHHALFIPLFTKSKSVLVSNVLESVVPFKVVGIFNMLLYPLYCKTLLQMILVIGILGNVGDFFCPIHSTPHVSHYKTTLVHPSVTTQSSMLATCILIFFQMMLFRGCF